MISKLESAKKGYVFDDVLLIPKLSAIDTRAKVDTSVDLGKGIKLSIPVVSANMKHVTEVDMAKAIALAGGLPLLHRFCTLEEQITMFKHSVISNDECFVGSSLGVKEEDKQRAAALVNAGCRVLCVDVAHGHSTLALKMTEYLAKTYPKVLLIVGNVATGAGTKALMNAGANVIKVGIGGSGVCTTRIETGNGVPQLTALEEAREAIWNKEVKLIADGGIRRAGDMVKALVYADAVMVGSLLAGTNEAPGSIIEVDGRKYKEYAGSSTLKKDHIEGVSALVSLKGSVKDVLKKLMQGVRSGCSYQGAKDLAELRAVATFVVMSSAGLTESHPHTHSIWK